MLYLSYLSARVLQSIRKFISIRACVSVWCGFSPSWIYELTWGLYLSFGVPFYKPAFIIVYLRGIHFSVIDVLSYQEGFLSTVVWRNQCILQQYTDIFKDFYLLFVTFTFIWFHILYVRLNQITSSNYKFNFKLDNVLSF